ncbi:aspartyl protease family protein [Dyella telluris]|uniref:Aspartyl protease family protein n=1 Tax=Dyella telluris TaxID=2763498 RepID=A0A7G8Q7A0_9GAMM|nr:aspartyl protease family protein [Dyella telluris]QNK02658.1 aspartyl protease family protein [Dyella telluris]
MKKKNLPFTLSVITALLTACTPAQQDQQATPPKATDEPLLTTALRPYAQPLVPVTIDGKTYHFILDTGAPYTFIDTRTAAALTKAMPDAEVPEYFRHYIGGLGTLGNDLDIHQMTYWQPRPLLIGRQPVANSVPWVGMDLSAFDQSYGTHVDGLLGATAFRQLNWSTDNLTGTLTIDALPPSTAGYERCAPYEDAFGAGPDLTIQLANGNGGPMRIDTGASYDSISADTLRVLGEQGANVEKIGQATRLAASGPYDANVYLVGGLQFGDTPIGKLKVYESSGANNLGMSFLSRFDKYVFIPSEMLFCYTTRQLGRDDQRPVRQLELSAEQGHLVIGTANRSPEGLASGLQVDDVLLTVNGNAVKAIDIEAIRHQLADAPSGSLTLGIERHGEAMIIKL